MRRSLLALAITLTLSISAAHAHDHDHDQKGGDISRVNGGITAEAGTTYGDLGTVNGGISVRKGATAQDVETVNGGITLDDDAEAATEDLRGDEQRRLDGRDSPQRPFGECDDGVERGGDRSEREDERDQDGAGPLPIGAVVRRQQRQAQ